MAEPRQEMRVASMASILPLFPMVITQQLEVLILMMAMDAVNATK